MKSLFSYKFNNYLDLEYFIIQNNGFIAAVIPETLIKLRIKNINNIPIKETPLIKNTAEQIQEYLNKKRKIFNIPIKPDGTEFQQKVWNVLQSIPYGETRSYKEVAIFIGNPKASRAIGMANNRNPIHIIIPCHRVIGGSGNLTGYAGGIEIKKFLLELENKNC